VVHADVRSIKNYTATLSKPTRRMDCRVKPGNDEWNTVLATRSRARALPTTKPNRLAPTQKGRRSAERRMPTIAAQHQQTSPPADAAFHVDKAMTFIRRFLTNSNSVAFQI
jgi:hypothetical protein